MKYLFAVLALMLFSIPASATLTAGRVVTSCKSEDKLETGLCLGYFTGLVDATSNINFALNDGTTVEVVYAENATVSQVIRVFLKYVADNPEVENKAASGVYVDALVKAKLIGFKPVARKATDQ